MFRPRNMFAAWRARMRPKGNAFDHDGRSKKVIFVPHCMLNQNARDAGSADFPAMMKPLLDVLTAHDIGIIQLPCPELMVLGLGRRRDSSPGQSIREWLESPESHLRLGYLIDQVVYQIKQYQAQRFDVVGILGKNGSPTCGVRTSHLAASGAHEGVFIRLLRQRLQTEGIEIGITGVDDQCQDKAAQWVLKSISAGKDSAD